MISPLMSSKIIISHNIFDQFLQLTDYQLGDPLVLMLPKWQYEAPFIYPIKFVYNWAINFSEFSMYPLFLTSNRDLKPNYFRFPFLPAKSVLNALVVLTDLFTDLFTNLMLILEVILIILW